MGKHGGWSHPGTASLALAVSGLLVGAATCPTLGSTRGASGSVISAVQLATCSGVSLYPSPGTRTASTATQISFQHVASAKVTASGISIVGSVTGAHSGRVVPDSSGRGASFYPDQPFAPGETVTVRSQLSICGASGGTASFQVAEAPPALPQTGPGPALTASPATQSFRSAPQLAPPALVVTKAAPPSAEGDIFVSPDPAAGGQAGQAGPMIVNGSGQLVWFDPLPAPLLAADFRVQSYKGKPVLTWFQGDYVDGHGRGEFVIMNDHYQVVRTVPAAEGYSADLHEFLLGPHDTAWMTVYDTIGWNLTAYGGPSEGAIYDGIVQELDLRTGNVLFEWHSLDHVSPANSYIPYVKGQSTPWDYFHVNSVDPTSRGTVLISARDTEAAYLLDETSGQIVWSLGGKSSSFVFSEGAQFALQHDVELHGQTTVTVFDDEDTESGGPPARAIELRLNRQRRTASLVWARQLPGFLLVLNQGNVQVLADGNVMVGWGAGTFTSEYSAQGKLLFNAHFPGLTSSYRAYRDRWSGQPTTKPAIAIQGSADGAVKVFASWNGSTTVTSWRVVGGSSASQLETVGSSRKKGFETVISIPHPPALLRVEALGETGQVLASSQLVPAG
ncbi:MAG: arylsulfotransferase family protein [Candidatus Dormibacteria bacterium]